MDRHSLLWVVTFMIVVLVVLFVFHAGIARENSAKSHLELTPARFEGAGQLSE